MNRERTNRENARMNRENARMNRENERMNRENERMNRENERMNREEVDKTSVNKMASTNLDSQKKKTTFCWPYLPEPKHEQGGKKIQV
jgi:hypothetical protein